MLKYREKYYQYLIRLTFIALLILYVVIFLLHPPNGKQPNVTVFLLAVIPIIIGGVLSVKITYRRYIWISFLAMIFFFSALRTVFSPGYLYYALCEVVLALVLFFCCVAAARPYKAQAKKIQKNYIK